MNIKVKFAELNKDLKANFGEVQTVTEYVGGDKYEGDYIVTPRVEAQKMETKGKVMLDDVTVKAIPYHEVSNINGGKTVFIGNEV